MLSQIFAHLAKRVLIAYRLWGKATLSRKITINTCHICIFIVIMTVGLWALKCLLFGCKFSKCEALRTMIYWSVSKIHNFMIQKRLKSSVCTKLSLTINWDRSRQRAWTDVLKINLSRFHRLCMLLDSVSETTGVVFEKKNVQRK